MTPWEQASDPPGGGTASIRLRSKALAFLLSTLATLVLSELGLRLLWHNPYGHEAPDHLLKLSMNHSNTDHLIDRALLDSEHPRVRLRTDGRSYILPSSQYRDPDVTIAFLGGSTTECLVVQENLRYPALVSTLLAEHGRKVNILNAARSGNTLHDSLNILLNHVVDDEPDIVVLMHASNDVGVLAGDGDYRTRVGHPASLSDLGKWSFQMASSNVYLTALARNVVTSGAVLPTDASTDWRHDSTIIRKLTKQRIDAYRRRLKTFTHMSRDFGITPVLMTEPFSGSTNSLTPNWVDATAQDVFNNIIREVGDEENVLVIDLVSHIQKIRGWNEPMKVFYDAIHVTDEGSRLYAQHIAERLLPEITANVVSRK